MGKIILIFLMFTVNNSFSQDSLIKRNQLRYTAFGGWRMDGKKISMKEFKNEIYKVPTAIMVYSKGIKNHSLYYASTGTMFFCVLLSRPVRDISSPRFGKRNLGFGIAGLISAGFSFYFLFRSQKQLNEAARIHNENRAFSY